MIAGIAAALSGMQTGGRILGVGANNIANAQTEGFTRIRALPKELSSSGVTVILDRDEGLGSQIFSHEDLLILRKGSNIDLGEEIISHHYCPVKLKMSHLYSLTH